MIVHLFALLFVFFVHNLGMKCKIWHHCLCICPIMTINDKQCRREGDVWLYILCIRSLASPVHPSIPVKLGLASVLKPSRGGTGLPEIGGCFTLIPGYGMRENSRNKPSFTGRCVITVVITVITPRFIISRIFKVLQQLLVNVKLRRTFSPLAFVVLKSCSN